MTRIFRKLHRKEYGLSSACNVCGSNIGTVINTLLGWNVGPQFISPTSVNSGHQFWTSCQAFELKVKNQGLTVLIVLLHIAI